MAAGSSGAVWVGFPRTSMIQRVDAATNEVTGQIRLAGDGIGAIAADDLFDEVSGTIWAAATSGLKHVDLA